MPKTKPKNDEVVVHNTRRGTVRMPELGTLLPGANIVKRAVVDLAKERTGHGKPYSSWPKFVQIDEEAPVGTVGREDADAIALAEDTFDLAILKKYMAEELRPNVRSAIAGQIDLVTKEPEDDDEE